MTEVCTVRRLELESTHAAQVMVAEPSLPPRLAGPAGRGAAMDA